MKNPRERIIIAIFLLITFFTAYSIIIFSSKEPSTSARAAVLYEPTTESFLYSKNADERLAMASTTKIMTALVAIENSELDKEIEVADEAIGIEGSSLYLKCGEVLTMRELIIGLMLRSANDAAVAIAHAVSGNVENFADLMNQKACELGLSNTHFTNPHGLDDPEHYTTAKELALISAKALENETFREIASSRKETIKNSVGEARLVVNHNKLLSMYDGAIGVKTGFTKRCGRCLVGAAERDGLRFITVTINAPDDWNDHISMFNYGYSLLEMRHIADVGEYCYKLPVIGGENSYISVSNRDSFNKILKKSDKSVIPYVELSRYVSAPIKKGDVLGVVIFKLDGTVIGEIELVADENSQLKKNKGLFTIA